MRSLLVIFRACWEQETIPSSWREARIQPLMKHSASRRVDELRPISLLSVVSKMYDSIVLERLQRVSETREWVPDYQAGFRKHRSAVEHLIQLQQEGHTAFKEGKVLVVAFLDISKAYDCVKIPHGYSVVMMLALHRPYFVSAKWTIYSRARYSVFRKAV